MVYVVFVKTEELRRLDCLNKDLVDVAQEMVPMFVRLSVMPSEFRHDLWSRGEELFKT